MTTVFIAGSMNIKRLDALVKSRIDNIVASDFKVVIGDADGADSSVQRYLLDLGAMATVYCSGQCPRNNVGEWPVVEVETQAAVGSRAFFTAKDLAMSKAADFGLMIWDARSTGTLSNVLELLSQRKKSLVFVNKKKEFITVGNAPQLVSLVANMSAAARAKAEAKMGLSKRIADIERSAAQQTMF